MIVEQIIREKYPEYYDMDQVIAEALELADRELGGSQ